MNFSQNLFLGDTPEVPGAINERGAPASLHYIINMWYPEDSQKDEALTAGVIDSPLEDRFAWMQAAVDAGRSIRTRLEIPLKAPLLSAVLIHPPEIDVVDALGRDGADGFAGYVREELNVRQLTVTSDKSAYGVRLRARLNPSTCGPRLRGAFKQISTSLAALPQSALEEYLVVSTSDELYSFLLRMLLNPCSLEL